VCTASTLFVVGDIILEASVEEEAPTISTVCRRRNSDLGNTVDQREAEPNLWLPKSLLGQDGLTRPAHKLVAVLQQAQI